METGLQLVSEAHGHLKAIMASVRQLYMRAVNAMLNARRLGREVAGYQAVTLELRRFSTYIDESSEELQGRIQELVYCGAACQFMARRLHRLEEGMAGAATTVVRAAEPNIQTLRERLNQQEREVARLAGDVQRIRGRVVRLVESGRNLGLMLRTEAAANTALAGGIGDEIDVLMDRVTDDLYAIDRRMEKLNENRK